MGCFDFTYADNGRNIRGGKGYLYITKPLMNALGLKTPYIRFDGTNEYGDIFLKHADVDIYAVYAAMLALDGHVIRRLEIEDVNRFIDLFKSMSDDMDYQAFKDIMDKIRDCAIAYFFDNLKSDEHVNLTLPKMGNQPQKDIVTEDTFHGTTPLLITKKRINERFGTYADEIAANLCVTSGHDPNQGFAPTTNYWVAYKPKGGNDNA